MHRRFLSCQTGKASAAFVFERNVETHAVVRDLAVLHGEIEARRFRNAQIANGPARGLDRVPGRSLPRVGADADDLGDAVHAVAHFRLLSGRARRRGSYVPTALVLGRLASSTF